MSGKKAQAKKGQELPNNQVKKSKVSSCLTIENLLVNLQLPKGKGGSDKLRAWDQQIQTTIYKTDKQQGPTVQHKELYSIPCNNL